MRFSTAQSVLRRVWLNGMKRNNDALTWNMHFNIYYVC
jgi:hypothetical protein